MKKFGLLLAILVLSFSVVAGSAVFGAEDPRATIEALRNPN